MGAALHDHTVSHSTHQGGRCFRCENIPKQTLKVTLMEAGEMFQHRVEQKALSDSGLPGPVLEHDSSGQLFGS